MLCGRKLTEDVRDAVRAGKHFERLLFTYEYIFLRPLDQCLTCHKKYHRFPIGISSVSQTGSQSNLACVVYVCVYFGGLVIDAHIHTYNCVGV